MLGTLRESVVASFGHRHVSLLDVLRVMQLRGQLKPLLTDLVVDEAITQYAEEYSLSLSDEELQLAADQFRRSNALLSASETHVWLQEHGITPVNLQRFLELSVLRDRVFQHVTQDAHHSFQKHSMEWDRVTLQAICVENKDLAEELASQLFEGSADFADLARQYSRHPSAQLGGRLDPVYRRELPESLATALASAAVGQIVGPLMVEEGWCIFLVENLHEAVFDKKTEATVRSKINSDWLSEILNSDAVSFPLLSDLRPSHAESLR